MTLDEAVDASNVEGFLTTGSEGTNTVQTHGKDFALKLESNSETYAAGSAISVSATSWYLGPGTTTVSTYGVVFGYEQLDGPSVMYPASELMCGDVRTLQKNDQETHANSVQLRVGVYRLIAVLSFADGACGGERVSVESSIVVHVVASTLDCSGPDVPVTLIDSTGLVERCRMNVKVDQVQQPTFTNPGNDLSTLRFTSITAPCTDSRVVHFIEQPGGYGLGVASQVHTPPPGYVGCDAIVWFSIDLDLRSEVDASRVALTP